MDYRRKNTNQLYIMESSEYVKIGVSSDSVKRLGRLNNGLPEFRKFKLVKVKVCKDRYEALKLEKYMHLKFKDFQTITDIIGAKTECFSKDILNVALEDLDVVCELYPFDPYIVVNLLDVPRIFGYSIIELYQIVGFDIRFKKGFNLALRNIAANVVAAKGRKIFYSQRVVKMLGLSGDTVYRVLSRIWPNSTSIELDSYDYKLKMVDPYLYPKRVLDFSKISLGYIASIESLYAVELHKSKGVIKAVEYIMSQINST